MSRARRRFDRVVNEIVAAARAGDLSATLDDQIRKLPTLIMRSVSEEDIKVISRALKQSIILLTPEQVIAWISNISFFTANDAEAVMRRAYVRAVLEQKCAQKLRAIPLDVFDELYSR